MLLTFDFNSKTPIYLQLRNQIVVGIAEGRLKPGDRLPTIRALAEESGINMMTVSKAYQTLKQEGYIVTDRRTGTRVAPAPKLAKVQVDQASLDALNLAISELRLAGLSKAEILELCAAYYEEETNV